MQRWFGKLEDRLIGKHTCLCQPRDRYSPWPSASSNHDVFGRQHALTALQQRYTHLTLAQESRLTEDQIQVGHRTKLEGLLLTQGVTLAAHLS